MEKMIITHYDTRDYIYPLNRNTLLVKLQCKSDTEYSVYIVYWNKFFKDIKEYKLENFSLNGQSEFYGIKLSFDEPVKYISYYFKLSGAHETFYYSPYGLTSAVPKKFFDYPSTNVEDVFTIPDWAHGAIGYQIFPERFFNGDPDNDPLHVEQWNGPPSRTNFFGGDLRGIIKRFAHIKDLGIDIIYLTPIFESPSNHKYDTIDYYKIDPSFGDMKDLKELVALCHSHSMKLILDGVFNHIGYYSRQFQDAIRNGKQSRYWDWFYIHGEQVDTEAMNYECVGYYKWMPKLNYSNQEVREYFLSVGEYWIKEAGIDGWRLDVADEVDFTFWQEFRKRIKRIDKNLLLIGETWKNGSDLLRGDQMDSIMNYRFRDAAVDYFAERSITREAFAERIEGIYFDYPYACHNILYNLLDSHDTARFLTTCQGDLNKLKLAVVFQMTCPGLPFVYYGDEIGMTGDTDPNCRKTMAWDSINHDIIEFYKKMIRIRKSNDALKYGDFKHIYTKCEVYGLLRAYEDELIFVFLNNSDNDYELSCEELLNEYYFLEDSRMIVDLPANTFEILCLVREGGKYKVKSNARDLKLTPNM